MVFSPPPDTERGGSELACRSLGGSTHPFLVTDSYFASNESSRFGFAQSSCGRPRRPRQRRGSRRAIPARRSPFGGERGT